jgi:hypothetical protein
MNNNNELVRVLKRLDTILNDDEKHDEYYCLDKARAYVDEYLKMLEAKKE